MKKKNIDNVIVPKIFFSNTEILNMTWNNKEQRNLEEEGFYVPEAPKFAKRHLKILEHRLFDPDDW